MIDYKFLREKYFIGERDGKGKEYNKTDGELIFKGNYIDGKRNGYGKEYYKEKYNGKIAIKFEGKYLDDKINGKGIEYHNNGKIEFEGIYLLGLKYKGKSYDTRGSIIYVIEDRKRYIKKINKYGFIKFEGEYPSGKGKEYLCDKKIKFEGEYINGIKYFGIGYDKAGNILYKLKNDI